MADSKGVKFFSTWMDTTKANDVATTARIATHTQSMADIANNSGPACPLKASHTNMAALAESNSTALKFTDSSRFTSTPLNVLNSAANAALDNPNTIPSTWSRSAWNTVAMPTNTADATNNSRHANFLRNTSGSMNPMNRGAVANMVNASPTLLALMAAKNVTQCAATMHPTAAA